MVVSSVDLSAYGCGGTAVPQSVECLRDPGGEGMHVLVGLRDGKLASFRCGLVPWESDTRHKTPRH